MPGGKRKTLAKFIVFGIVSLDQLTKYIVSQNIPLGESIPIAKNIFHITYIVNRGAAFGLFRNQTYLFVASAIIAIVFILINLRLRQRALIKIPLYLILAGAISNLIDRIRLGAVIDFLDFRIWPVFNIADTAITIGAILLAYSLLMKPVRTKQA